MMDYHSIIDPQRCDDRQSWGNSVLAARLQWIYILAQGENLGEVPRDPSTGRVHTEPMLYP